MAQKKMDKSNRFVHIKIDSQISAADVAEEIVNCRIPVKEIKTDQHSNSLLVSLHEPFDRRIRQIKGMRGVKRVESAT